MNTLSFIFRRTARPVVSTSASVTRARKKKGGKGGAAPVSDDIVNIFKDREDPIILPSEYYPKWLFENVGGKLGPEEVFDLIRHGKYLPTQDTAKHTWTYANNLARLRIRLENDYGNQEKVYDSDEDWREPDDGEVAFIMNKEAKEQAYLANLKGEKEGD